MILDERRVVHVRGTPASGKTTLALLLLWHYKKRGERVIFLNGWQMLAIRGIISLANARHAAILD